MIMCRIFKNMVSFINNIVIDLSVYPGITWLPLVKQNPSMKNPMKIGYNCEDGWIAYQNKGVTFIKKFEHMIDGEYPDNGCSAECYTNDQMQEMETLSPLYELAPGESITYAEEWHALALNSPEISCEKDAVEVFG